MVTLECPYVALRLANISGMETLKAETASKRIQKQLI